MSRLRPHMKLTLRIYAERDADLYRWLQELDAFPYGRKAEIVKAVLRRGLEALEAKETGGDRGGQVDLVEIQQAVTAAMAEALADIRRIVEAAVATALAEVQMVATARPGEEDRDEELLDDLEDSLVV